MIWVKSGTATAFGWAASLLSIAYGFGKYNTALFLLAGVWVYRDPDGRRDLCVRKGKWALADDYKRNVFGNRQSQLVE
jgi:hypothetical protein